MQVADILGVAPKRVLVGYRFNMPTKREEYQHLNTEELFQTLIKDAIAMIDGQKKAKGAKAKKKLVVELKDLRDDGGKGKKKGKKEKVCLYIKDCRVMHNADMSVGEAQAPRWKPRAIIRRVGWLR